MSLPRQLFAEALGTLLLLAIVIGSGVMAERLAFELTRQALGYRLLQLLALPLAAMGNAELQGALASIARS